jgi:predicted lipoprotein with Yx(FWY)xxD motif
MRLTIIAASTFMALSLTGYAAAQEAEPTMPAAVKLTYGMLTDSKGMSLYTYDNDKEANKSACAGNCVSAWPVLKAEAADKDIGDWKVITRDDGTKQWAYKGKPLYYFAQDKMPGDKIGDERGNVWHLAKP